jgi:hypothetical protein
LYMLARLPLYGSNSKRGDDGDYEEDEDDVEDDADDNVDEEEE